MRTAAFCYVENLMSFVDIVGNALSGGVLGAAGAAFSRWHEAKLELTKLAIANQQALKLAEHELERMKLAQDGAGLAASAPVDAATYSTETSQYASSQLMLVDAVRGLVRPLLTALLLCSTMYYTNRLLTIVGMNLTPAEAHQLLQFLLESTVSCTGIALTWWFGARPTKQTKPT